jgi:hypothetical protein
MRTLAQCPDLIRRHRLVRGGLFRAEMAQCDFLVRRQVHHAGAAHVVGGVQQRFG